MNKREQILTALTAWAHQRPGLEFANYGDVASYRSEQRRIARQLRDFKALLAAVNRRDSIGESELRKAFRGAYAGRLSLHDETDGAVRLDYCTGQYWPVEYRAAACAVLASALWAYWRERCPGEPILREVGISAGSWIRNKACDELGGPLARRWMDYDHRSAKDRRKYHGTCARNRAA